jgi:hypothetical protein
MRPAQGNKGRFEASKRFATSLQRELPQSIGLTRRGENLGLRRELLLRGKVSCK